MVTLKRLQMEIFASDENGRHRERGKGMREEEEEEDKEKLRSI